MGVILGFARKSSWAACLGFVVSLLVVSAASEVSGQPAGGSTAPSASIAMPALSAEVPAAAKKTTKATERAVQKYRDLARRIEQLVKGVLPITEEPQSLFSISLADDEAVAVEAKRLAAVIERVKRPAEEPVIADGGVDGGAPEASVADTGAEILEYDALRTTNPERWKARIALDEARLAFLGLSKKRRAEILAAHKTRQRADSDLDKKKKLERVDKKAELEEQRRRRAVKAANEARSEAERAVHQEHASLIAVARRQAEFEKSLIERKQVVDKRSEVTLKWAREIKELLDRARSQESAARIDKKYRSLREHLKGARAELREALGKRKSSVPRAETTKLAGIPDGISTKIADRERKKVEEAASKLAKTESSVTQANEATLLSQVETLNKLRLSMLPYLSPEYRGQVTGFGPSGVEQALAEVSQVWLVLRSHLRSTLAWATELRGPGAERGKSAWDGFDYCSQMAYSHRCLCMVATTCRVDPDQSKEELARSRSKETWPSRRT